MRVARMVEMDPTESAQDIPVLTRRERARAEAALQAERKRELDASMAVLNARRDIERRARFRQQCVNLWPLWLGIFLGLLSPVIKSLAEGAGPWFMPLFYPYVVLAKRPEIQVGPITRWLPIIMLFAQFPLEGLLAAMIMKRNIRPWGVAWHVLTFHFLGIAELLMLSGVAQYVVRR